MKARKAGPHVPIRRFVRAPGSPIASDEDAQIIGEELLRIAESLKVDDVRTLDAHTVYEMVEADPHHPLRPYYDWDDKSAARKHRIAWTGQIVRSLRVEVRVGKTFKQVKAWIACEAPVRRGDEVRPRRTRVLRDDVLRNDPVMASALGMQLRLVVNALGQLESLATSMPSEDPVVQLARGLRALIDQYRARIDAAAE